MNFKKCKKGEYGYLAYKKTYETIYFSILALIIISVFVAGIIINHTRKNLYTVIAILIVLPAAKVLVNLIMLYRFKSMDTGEYNKITQYEKNNIILYDMPLSTPDCIIFAPIILIREKEVFIYNLNKIKSPDKCESYIKNFARNDAANRLFLKRLLTWYLRFPVNTVTGPMLR